MAKSLVLVGFMGAGKSTAGRIVAQRLGLAYVDADRVVESRAGKRISDIFAQDGEAAFRALEREVTIALAQEEGLVIAAGGGAFVDPATRESLLRTSVTAYLAAPFEALWNRIEDDPDRPLLGVPDAKARMEALLNERVPIYEEAHLKIDSTQTIETVVGELTRGYRAIIGG